MNLFEKSFLVQFFRFFKKIIKFFLKIIFIFLIFATPNKVIQVVAYFVFVILNAKKTILTLSQIFYFYIFCKIWLYITLSLIFLLDISFFSSFFDIGKKISFLDNFIRILFIKLLLLKEFFILFILFCHCLLFPFF